MWTFIICIFLIDQVLSNPELNAYCLNDGCVLVADRMVVALDNICQTLKMFIHFGEFPAGARN